MILNKDKEVSRLLVHSSHNLFLDPHMLTRPHEIEKEEGFIFFKQFMSVPVIKIKDQEDTRRKKSVG